MKCRGVTSRGVKCKIDLGQGSGEEFCRYHAELAPPQPKPESCCVCTELLETERRPLDCGHWIHRACVVQSAKAECPLCRAALRHCLSGVDKREIKRIKARRLREQIEEDHQELVREIDNSLGAMLPDYLHDRLDRLLTMVSNYSQEFTEGELAGMAAESGEVLTDTVLVELIQEMNRSESYNSLITAITGFVVPNDEP
jgi:hypothetical protein